MEFSEKYGRWVVKWRWPMLLLPVILSVIAAYGGQFLKPSGDYRIFFGAENPQLTAFEELQDTYTKIDNVFFAVQPHEGDIFTPEILTALEELTTEAWTLPHATRVDSLTNFQHTRADGDDLFVADLVRGASALEAREIEEIRTIALAEPGIFGRALSPDQRAAGVNVTLQLPGLDLEETPIVAQAALAMAEDLESRFPVRVEVTGMVMLNNAFTTVSIGEMVTLVPLMYLVIVLMIFLLVRSLTATISATVVTFLSILTAMGAAGWMGMLITPPSSVAPTVIATLAVADSIHFLVSMFTARAAGEGSARSGRRGAADQSATDFPHQHYDIDRIPVDEFQRHAADSPSRQRGRVRGDGRLCLLGHAAARDDGSLAVSGRLESESRGRRSRSIRPMGDRAPQTGLDLRNALCARRDPLCAEQYLARRFRELFRRKSRISSSVGFYR